MPSIASLVAEGRSRIPVISNLIIGSDSPFEEIRLLSTLQSHMSTIQLGIRSGECKFIRVDSVFRDVDMLVEEDGCIAFNWKSFRRVIPPFRVIWIEGTFPSGNHTLGYLVQRKFINEKIQCSAYVFLRQGGIAVGPVDVIVFTTDAEGVLIDGSGRPITLADGSIDKAYERATQAYFLLLNCLQRINCGNASLKELYVGKPKHRSGNAKKGLIWNEIIIGDSPATRSNATGIDSNLIEIRLHSVRGHYADYTRGNGMFGNPNLRKIFWISDHIRGNSEVGEVRSVYKVRTPHQE